MLTEEQLKELDDIQQELDKRKRPYERLWKEIIHYMGISYGVWDDDKKPYDRLTDMTAAEASGTLADGVAGYAFSRSLDWFDYEPSSSAPLTEPQKQKVRTVLGKVKAKVYSALNASDFYNESRNFIRSGADLGTAAMYMTYDKKKGVYRFKTLHIKDYWIMTDDDGEVDTLFRRIFLTKKEALKYFDEDRLPQAVKDSDDRMKLFEFYQMISPAVNWDFEVSGTGDWISLYWSKEDLKRTILEERLTRKPFAVWRWSKQMYGGEWGVDAPGMMCYPAMRFVNVLYEDLITLSELQAKGLWKKTKGLYVNFKPGSVTELEAGQDFGFMQYAGNLQWLQEHIAKYTDDINRAYKIELFLILSQNIDRTKTATEVAGIETEKSNLMQAFFSRLSLEFLEPLHEFMYGQVLLYDEADDITPEDIGLLNDLDIDIDFVSPAYLAQKRNFRLTPTLQWIQDVMTIAQVNPNVIDKIDFDTLVDIDHDVRKADSGVLVSTEDANKAREIRAQAEALEAQKAEQLANLDALTKAISALPQTT